MRNVLIALTACSVVLAGPVTAAPPFVPPPALAAPAVLSQIPAGTVGFIVIGNVKGFAGQIDKFIAAIGLEKMAEKAMPEGMLPALRKMMGMAASWTGDGPTALVMLNPKSVGMDFAKMVERRMAASMGVAPAPEQAEEIKLPIIWLVPGEDLREVFAPQKPEMQGGFATIKLPNTALLATNLGRYIALSPNLEALKVLKASKQSCLTELDAEHLALVAKSEVAVHVNMEVSGPILRDILKAVEETIKKQQEEQARQFEEMMRRMQEEGGEGPPMMGPPPTTGPMNAVRIMLAWYRDFLKSLGDTTLGARFVPTGVVLEQLVSWEKTSEIGKLLLAAKATPGPLLNRLPDLPYVLAAGTSGGIEGAEKVIDLYLQMIDAVVSSTPLGAIQPKDREKIMALAQEMVKQTRGVQFVAGGAPGGHGLFALAAVIDCQDAAKVKSLIADGVAVIDNLIREKVVNMGREDTKPPHIAYVKGPETAGQVAVDAISITHPDMAEMTEKARENMRKVLGEDKIQMYVAAPDQTTVVVTFGGTADMLAATLKTAGGKGGIETSQHLAEPLKYMPKNRSTLLAINGSNLFDLIIDGKKKMDPEAEPPSARIACRVPVVIGAAIEGASTRTVAYVPTRLVKDAVLVWLSMQKAREGAAEPVPVPPMAEEF